MKQNTITLNQQSVAALDELESALKMPKAKIVQKALIKFKNQFAQVFAAKKQPPKYRYFDKLAGSIKLKTKKKTNYALTVDDIYFSD